MSRAERIRQQLQTSFEPLHLEVTDESHMHDVPPDGESHFRVVLVSEAFSGESLIKRHRAVNALLKGEFGQGLHALALHTMTPAEWFEKGGAPDSPPCLGGGKHS